MISRDIFKERIHDLRESKNLTLEELAEELNLSLGTVGHWESGIRIPSLDVALRVADFFGVSIDYLVGRTDNPKINE